MKRENYEQELEEVTATIAERLRARSIGLAFMDAGWLAAWHSTSPHHEKVKHHTPPITIVQGSSIDDLLNKVYIHLNDMYAAYKGLLLNEDMQAHMVINNTNVLRYRDGTSSLYILVFQATVIHKGEHVTLSTSMRDGANDGNATTP
jgi:hypothetical protein